jgi:aminoglycoside adenylyltransferase-like protein/nucleotidyltransferase-like protein
MRGRIMDPRVGKLLTRLVDHQTQALGDDLVGSYLFGSVITGDFDSGISDVDTVAVVRSDLTEAQLATLERLHRDIVEEIPEWKDRVEAVYLSSQALATFRTASSAAARISPGEPFHAIEVDHRWLIDWYRLRDVGIALCGPPPASIVPIISHDDYVEAVRRHMLSWPEWVDGFVTQGAQAYAILTMCRGLRTWRTGEFVSKREAARWACQELPDYADLIRDAVAWRERSRNGPPIDCTATRDVTRRFVMDVERLVD